MKKEIRVLGIDDGPFDKDKKGNCIVIGALFRGGEFLDGLMSTKIRVDGRNAATKLISMINRSKWKCQIKYIMLDGIALGGFNIIDASLLFRKTHIPIVIVIRKRPDISRIKDVLWKIGKKDGIRMIDDAGEVYKEGRVYFQVYGCTEVEGRDLIKHTIRHADIPEPIRIAHIIASGLVLGESRGKA